MATSSCWTKLLLLMMFLGSTGMASARQHMSVNIINDVGETPFYVHCKSGDNDLQLQTVLPHQKYGFGFEANVMGTTLFWCNFQWGSRSQGFTVWQDIGFWGNQPRFCSQCVWRVRAEGFYRSEGASGPFYKIYEWK